MHLTFDPAKDSSNLEKHGVSLAQTSALKCGTLVCQPDDRRDYGELRQIVYAKSDARRHCVVFGDRHRMHPQNAAY